VGSIGVWQAHEDISGALLYEGIDVTLISAGKYKVEGNPYEPLTEEATDFLQSRVDEYYSVFVESVATARGVTTDAVIQGMGQGRVVGAATAVSLGMVDGVMAFDQVVSLMQSRVKPKASRLSQARNSLALI
jgi:ClpP class serine protease